jgi:Zn-finger protein
MGGSGFWVKAGLLIEQTKRVVFMCQDCDVLHQRLKEQAEEMYHMKKSINQLRTDLRYAEREKRKMLKENRKRKKG